MLAKRGQGLGAGPLVAVAIPRHRAGEALARHGGVGDQTLAAGGELLGGERGDGRAIEPGAEMRGDGAAGAQTTGHRTLELGAEGLQIGRIAGQLQLGLGVPAVIAPRLDAFAVEDQDLTGLDPVDVLVEGLGADHRQQAQIVVQTLLADGLLDAGDGEQGLGQGGKGEVARGLVPIERTGAKRVARQPQTALARLPAGQGEVAEQAVDGIGLPAQAGVQCEGAVGHQAQLIAGDAEGLGELVAVVETAIEEDERLALGMHQRLAVEAVLGGGAQQGAQEAGAGLPVQVLGIASVGLQQVAHPLQDGGVDGRLIGVDETGDGCHVDWSR